MKVKPEKEPRRVFADPSGLRMRLLAVLALVLILLALGWAGEFAYRVYSLRPLPILTGVMHDTVPDRNVALPAMTVQTGGIPDCRATRTAGAAGQRLVAAYVPAADRLALAGLQDHCGALDLILFEAMEFGLPDGTVTPLLPAGYARLPSQPASRQATGADMAAPVRVPVAHVLAGVSTWSLEELLASEAELSHLASGLAAAARQYGGNRLCIDLSDHADIWPDVLTAALGRLAEMQPTLDVCLIAPVDAAFWQDPALVRSIDFAVVQAFRVASSPAAPPAPQPWFEAAMATIRESIPQDKLIVALGAFAEGWQSGSGRATRLSYAEAMLRAASHDSRFSFAPVNGGSKISYLDPARRVNEVWLLDAVSFRNQIATLAPDQAVAVWPVGSEDPAVWQLLQAGMAGAEAERQLEAPIDLGRILVVEGGGPFFGDAPASQPGHRVVARDPATDRIVDQHYSSYPLPNRLLKFGKTDLVGLAVTFDGLPRQEDLTALMGMLDAYGVRATFFVDGSMLLQRAASAQSLLEAGHLLGLREAPATGTSGALAEFGTRMADNAMQMLLAHDFGLRTRLLMAQHGDDPASESLAPFRAASRWRAQGYLPVHVSFSAPYGSFAPEAFAERVLRDRDRAATDVLSFDLSAANGANVIAALPQILSLLVTTGNRFVSLPAAAGLDAAALMPVATTPSRAGDWLAYGVVYFFLFALTEVFLWLLVIAAVRALIYLMLALLRRPRNVFDPDFTPPVTVIVPAFNEEKVIVACIESLLQSHYPNYRIVVVDDGSTDRTAANLRDRFGRNAKVRLLHEMNQGKWHAANLALSVVDTPIFIVADADSMFLPDTIRWLVQQFKDARVGAVAGLVEVGNRENLLTDWQEVEYIVSQSVMRRAYETFNGILVVPGAVGAWRTEAVRQAGSFSGETITEDADLTVAVHRAGYLVRFQEQARSVTEAPETVLKFMRQRLRWSLGMLQVSWKHRGAIAEGRAVGISVIDAIWFAMATGILSPLVDILLLVLLGQGAYAMATKGALAFSGFPSVVLFSYFFLTMIDIANTVVAFRFERRFDWKLLALVPLMRFGYRQLLYLSAIRALLRAVAGRPSGWHKLDRTGAVFRRLSPASSVLVLEPKDMVSPGHD